LKYYKEADYQREHLSNRFIEYNQQYKRTQKYLDTPFLWFAVDYFSHANITLSLAKYDGKTFYEYLTNPLKRTKLSEGLFSLIKNKTSLIDLKWEILQVTSTRIDINLLDKHLLALTSTYKTIEELGIHSLDSSQLKKRLSKKTSEFPYMRDLENFHKLIGSQWTLWLYSPAFDLNRVYIEFLIPKDLKITNFISFNDSRNTSLCNSRIYYINESKNQYCGYLTIPSNLKTSLRELINLYQENGKIVVNIFEEITMERIATSFTLYNVKKGWNDSIPAYNKQILSDLKRKKDPLRYSVLSNFFMTPEFSSTWNFKNFFEPTKLIDLYCKNSGIYHFDTLPFNKVSNNDLTSIRFETNEIGFMKYLYEKGVCRITYVPNRLLYTFSPYQYEISLPSLPSNKHKHLLSWIPYARLFSTENHTFLWAYLTHKMVSWIQKELKWSVKQIVEHHYPILPHLDWFNLERCEWKKPWIFENRS